MKKGKKIVTVATITLSIILIICIANKNAILEAYYTHQDDIINNFAIGKIEASVTEDPIWRRYTNIKA